MGSAGGRIDEAARALCRELGRQIAGHNCIIITGACPGLPHEAVLGAKEVGVLALGISPALCLQEHIDHYRSPYEEYDALIFTGSGLMGREIEAIRTCDIVCIVGGRSGTLGEFAIAYDEGKLIAVLQGTGGIAEHIDDIVAIIAKRTDAEVVYSRDPAELIEAAIQKHYERVRRGVAYQLRVVDG
ncbi:MAG: hypothetical protein KKI08_27520 [Armatimonadetes bacterium]|nr:hypothetical protein [Armatimonadota bacterium]